MGYTDMLPPRHAETSNRDARELVRIFPGAPCAAWLRAFAIATVLPLALFFVLAGRLVSLPPMAFIDNEDIINSRIVNYALARDRRIVLVGTSLSDLLSDSFFQCDGVHNMSMSGGSPMTGLLLLETFGELPALIIVEGNFNIDADSKRIKAYTYPFFSKQCLLLQHIRPLRVLAAYALHDTDPAVRRRDSLREAETILHQAPIDHGVEAEIRDVVEQRHATDNTIPAQRYAAEVSRVVRNLEAHGTNVVFLDVPLPPPIARLDVYTVTRRMLDAVTPHPWIALTLTSENLRWKDHVHLDQRSSVMVIRAIERWLPETYCRHPGHARGQAGDLPSTE